MSTLFSLYIRDAGSIEDNVDAGWLGRQGVALALHSSADVLRTKDLPVVMTFLISRALVGLVLFNQYFLWNKKFLFLILFSDFVIYLFVNWNSFCSFTIFPILLNVQADPNADVRGRMINAGIMIIDKHGRDNVSLLFPIFENYLNKKVCGSLWYRCCPYWHLCIFFSFYPNKY